MPRHTLPRRPLWERLATAASVATSILLPAGAAWVALHPGPGGNHGQVCRPLPGTTRLDCGE